MKAMTLRTKLLRTKTYETMKVITLLTKLFTVILIFSLSKNIQAQDSSNNSSLFTNPTARWFTIHSYSNANEENPSFIETKTTIYGYSGDTLINDETWLKMYSSPDSAFVENLSFEGYVSANDSVILFRTPNEDVKILYDFNLQVGDSAYYSYNVSDSVYFTIEEINEVNIMDNNHKEIIFQSYQLPLACSVHEVWIEGIGSRYNPLHPISPSCYTFDYIRALTCFFVDDELYWKNDSYNQCYINNVLSTDEHELHRPIIYPNPAKNQITIDVGKISSSKTHIQIYDMQGRTVFSESFNKQVININTSNYHSGMYMLDIRQADNIFKSKIYVE